MMMISRDNINNYVRNLCSGDYSTAFIQFFLHRMSNAWTFFAKQCCDLCIYMLFVCVRVCQCQIVHMRSASYWRPLFFLPFVFSYNYIVFKAWNQISGREKKRWVNIHGDERLFRSICYDNTHTHIVYMCIYVYIYIDFNFYLIR